MDKGLKWASSQFRCCERCLKRQLTLAQQRPRRLAAVQGSHHSLFSASATVICEKKRHRISLNSRGQLIFHDHTPDQLRRSANLEELGGVACRCSQVLKTWREFIACCRMGINARLYDIPRGSLQEFARDLWVTLYHPDWDKRLSNGFEGMKEVPDCLQKLRGYARPYSIGLACTRLLHTECSVPRDVRCCVRDIGEPAYSFQLWRDKEPLFESAIPKNWIDTVYKAGFAAVQGALTLFPLEEWTDKPRRSRIPVVLCRPRLRKGVSFHREYVYLKRSPSRRGFVITRKP